MIRQFTQKFEDGSYPEGAFCLVVHKQYNQGESEMVMEDILHGCVLAIGEHNYYDDSDFYAIVWDSSIGQPRKIIYATTRAWSYPCVAVVDATPEIKATYSEWEANHKLVWDAYHKEVAAYVPEKGKLAKSITTKGKAKDLEGEIFWIGDSKFNGEKTVGIRDEDGRSAYVALERTRLWHEGQQEWVKPAHYVNNLRCWHTNEVPTPPIAY